MIVSLSPAVATYDKRNRLSWRVDSVFIIEIASASVNYQKVVPTEKRNVLRGSRS